MGRRVRLKITGLKGIPRYLLALAAGLCFGLAIAPYYFLPLLPLAFVSLVWLLDGVGAGAKGAREAFATGWFFGFSFFLVGLYWIAHPFLVDAEAYAWMMPFAVVSMPAGLALFTGAAALVAKLFWHNGALRIAVFAAAFVGLEYLRGTILTGFPWNLSGYVWGGVPAMLQVTSVIGIYGLSFVTVLAAASPAVLFAHPREGSNWRWPLFAALMVGVIWTSGVLRLADAPEGPGSFVPGVTLRIVQPNIPQADKLRPELSQEIWEHLLEGTAAPSSVPITHVIWPESAVPYFRPARSISELTLAGNASRRAEAGGAIGPDAILITGATRIERGPDDAIWQFNSIHVMDGSGEIIGTYDKHHLVPFGEYLPFSDLLNRIGFAALVQQLGSFQPGLGPRSLIIPGAPDAGPLVCYEAIFPGQIINPRDRPGWLVNVTDDSWFGNFSGPRQHLGMARVRAIEEGLPLVRSANTGISAVIDPYGRILEKLPLNSAGLIDSPLPRAAPPTIYSLVRDWPLLLLFLVVLLFSRIIRRKSKSLE